MNIDAISIVVASVIALIFSIMGFFSKKLSFKHKHVLVTGGSKGIGLQICKEFINREAHVTVVARNANDLSTAVNQLKTHADSKGFDLKIQAFSADTRSIEQLQKAIDDAVAAAGPIDVLVCCAGFSHPGLIIDTAIDKYESQMEVNYLGTVKPIKMVLPSMVERKEGRIVIVSSMLATIGFAGYSAYAPTKWALRGFADCLRNELQGTGVHISIAYPPDTDTPGYAAENLSKPQLCHVANNAVGSDLFPVEKAVKVMMKGIDRGDYHLGTPDLGSNLLINKQSSVGPKKMGLLVTVVLAPIIEVVTYFIAMAADRATRKYNEKHGYCAKK